MDIRIKKPKICDRISNESWEKLTLKEQDFTIFVHKRKSKSIIMRLLHIKDETTYWRIQEKVKNKLKNDIAKRNLIIQNIGK